LKSCWPCGRVYRDLYPFVRSKRSQVQICILFIYFLKTAVHNAVGRGKQTDSRWTASFRISISVGYNAHQCNICFPPLRTHHTASIAIWNVNPVLHLGAIRCVPSSRRAYPSADDLVANRSTQPLCGGTTPRRSFINSRSPVLLFWRVIRLERIETRRRRVDWRGEDGGESRSASVHVEAKG